MTSLLDSVAPHCSTAYVERDWEGACESALQTHPILSFAGALTLTGLGLVLAAVLFTTLSAVLLCTLMGIL